MSVNLDIRTKQSALRPTAPFLTFLTYFCSASLLSLGISASAQPVITSIQLSKSSAELTTLSGSGFGQFDGQVLSWDNVDDSSPGQLPNQMVGVNDWLSKDSLVIDKQFSISGSQSIKMDRSQANVPALGWKDKGPYTRLYISYWRRMEGKLTSHGTHQQLVLSGKSADKPPLLLLQISANQCWLLSGKLGGTVQASVNLPSSDDCWTQTTGKFQRWQFWVDLPNSRINGWLDNWSIFDFKIASTAIGFTNISLGQGASGLENGQTWFDDDLSPKT